MPLLTSNILGYEVDILSLAIAGLSLILAIVIAVGGHYHNSKILKATLRLDFSKRYQDLMAAMPQDEAFNERFALLYFDLCSEEYRLWQQHTGMVDDQTWLLWEEGMETALNKHPELTDYWQAHRNDYASTLLNEKESFQTFFDRKFIIE